MSGGLFRLPERAMVDRTRAGTILLLSLLILVGASCRRSKTGHRPFRIGAGATVDPGEPLLPAAPGHAGSVVCGDCHRKIFNSWAETFLNLSTRETDREGATGESVVGDADGNGKDDFRDGLDLIWPPIRTSRLSAPTPRSSRSSRATTSPTRSRSGW
jgi:hypothetical protein